MKNTNSVNASASFLTPELIAAVNNLKVAVGTFTEVVNKLRTTPDKDTPIRVTDEDLANASPRTVIDAPAADSDKEVNRPENVFATDEEVLNACYIYEEIRRPDQDKEDDEDKAWKKYRLAITPEFKECIDRAEPVDFIVDGKVYWRAGSPLPNPIRRYNVTSLAGTFAEFHKVKSLDISHWLTGWVTDMSEMCRNCYGLESLRLGDISEVQTMNSMCENCCRLTKLEIINAPKLVDVRYMCKDCIILDSLSFTNVIRLGVLDFMCLGSAVHEVHVDDELRADILNKEYQTHPREPRANDQELTFVYDPQLVDEED